MIELVLLAVTGALLAMSIGGTIFLRSADRLEQPDWFDVKRFRAEPRDWIEWEQRKHERLLDDAPRLGIVCSGPEVMSAALHLRASSTRRSSPA